MMAWLRARRSSFATDILSNNLSKNPAVRQFLERVQVLFISEIQQLNDIKMGCCLVIQLRRLPGRNSKSNTIGSTLLDVASVLRAFTVQIGQNKKMV